MNYYRKLELDGQHRICLKAFFRPGARYAFYYKEKNPSRFCIEKYAEKFDHPVVDTRKADEKGRIVVPKEFRIADKNEVWVSFDGEDCLVLEYAD